MLGGWIVFVVGLPALALHARAQVRSGVESRRRALELAFGCYLLLLVVVVLFPLRVDPGLRADDAVWDYASFLKNWVNLTPFATVRQLLARSSATQAVRQLGGNLLLLAPLGLFAPALFRRLQRPAPFLVVLVASAVGIECVQYLARLARLSLRSIDVDDAILNLLGGLVGFVVFAVWSRLGPRLTGGSS